MQKIERIKEYNNNNAGYCVTDIKYTTPEALQAARTSNWRKTSLYELYQDPSDAKIASWNDILRTYEPTEILNVQGSCFSYSVLLIAANGDLMHITKCNNYLVQIKDAK